LAPAPPFGVFPFQHALTGPAFASCTTASTTGGAVTLRGTGFLATPTASVFLSGFPGIPTALTVAFTNSTTLTLTLGVGVYSLGSYPVEVCNPNGGCTVSLGLFAVTTNSGTSPAPPVVTFSTDARASKAGAGYRIAGTGFVTPTAIAVLGSAQTSLTLVDSTSTAADYTVPSLAAATYHALVTNPAGTAITYANALVVTSTLDPWTIWAQGGPTVTSIYTPTNVTLGAASGPGYLITSMLDGSGLANTLSQAVMADQPLFTASDPICNGAASITANGTTDFMTTTTYNMGNGSIPAVVIGNVYRPAFTATDAFVSYWHGGGTMGEVLNHLIPIPSNGSLTWGATLLTSITYNYFLYSVVGTNQTLLINISNSVSPVSTTYTEPTITTPGPEFFFSGPGGSLLGGGVLCIGMQANAVPSSTIQSEWETYVQNSFGAQ